LYPDVEFHCFLRVVPLCGSGIAFSGSDFLLSSKPILKIVSVDTSARLEQFKGASTYGIVDNRIVDTDPGLTKIHVFHPFAP
jgi:hypothetical protein